MGWWNLHDADHGAATRSSCGPAGCAWSWTLPMVATFVLPSRREFGGDRTTKRILTSSKIHWFRHSCIGNLGFDLVWARYSWCWKLRTLEGQHVQLLYDPLHHGPWHPGIPHTKHDLRSVPKVGCPSRNRPCWSVSPRSVMLWVSCTAWRWCTGTSSRGTSFFVGRGATHVGGRSASFWNSPSSGEMYVRGTSYVLEKTLWWTPGTWWLADRFGNATPHLPGLQWLPRPQDWPRPIGRLWAGEIVGVHLRSGSHPRGNAILPEPWATWALGHLGWGWEWWSFSNLVRQCHNVAEPGWSFTSNQHM